MKKTLVIVCLFILLLFGWYYVSDSEHLMLTDETRDSAPGEFIDLPHGKVHYEMAGPDTANTVVLVHGFSVPYYIWDPTFDALVSAGIRVLRYDLYGRGYSDRPDTRYDAQLFDQQLSDLLNALEIGIPVDLIGLSMGGAIVTHFTAKRPYVVRKLVLIGSSLPQGESPVSSFNAPLFGELLMRTIVAPYMAENQLGDFYEPQDFPDWPAKYRVQMQYEGFQNAILSTTRHFFERDFTEDFITVGEQNRESLLVWGTQDNTISKSTIEKIRLVMPNIEFHKIYDAGHIPHYERPDIVNRIIIDFLKR